LSKNKSHEKERNAKRFLFQTKLAMAAKVPKKAKAGAKRKKNNLPAKFFLPIIHFAIYRLLPSA